MPSQASGLKLYEIPDALREIETEIMEADGELTPDVEAQLDALEGEFDRKAEYIALLAREAEAEEAGVKVEEQRLAARRKAAGNRAQRLKDYLLMSMRRRGVEKVEGDRAKIRVQANSRPSIEWMGEIEAIPEPFRRVRVDLDGRAVYDAWKDAGALPDGFRIEHGQHVRIR